MRINSNRAHLTQAAHERQSTQMVRDNREERDVRDV
jgi:hypothetical protein